MTCAHSGCNYPEGDCSGDCMTSTKEKGMTKSRPVCWGSNPGPQAKAENDCYTCMWQLSCARGTTETPSAMESQVGGDHYKAMPIQPFEYIHKNSIGFAEGCVIKYVSRWRAKNGIEDLKKARHFLDLLIEAESIAK